MGKKMTEKNTKTVCEGESNGPRRRRERFYAADEFASALSRLARRPFPVDLYTFYILLYIPETFVSLVLLPETIVFFNPV